MTAAGVPAPLSTQRGRSYSREERRGSTPYTMYIAPEVLERTEYNQACGWWSVSVILYKMLAGQPPFLANSSAETQL